MSFSFWIFLIAAILSCIPSVLDHGETLKNFNSSTGLEKRKYGLRLFLLWAIPVSFLIATVVSEVEAKKAVTESGSAFGSLSNKLQKVEFQYSEATNDLALAKQASIAAQSASREASAAASKIPKSRVLSNEAMERIAEKMMFVKPISIRVVIESREDDPAQLGSQFARIVGFRGVNRVEFINNLNEQIIGFKINTKSPPDDSLAAALNQMFVEIGQTPDISINANLNVDLEIVIGGRP